MAAFTTIHTPLFPTNTTLPKLSSFQPFFPTQLLGLPLSSSFSAAKRLSSFTCKPIKCSVSEATEPKTGEKKKQLLRRGDVRNIAIVAHVDHGKTTLVDAMLKQTKVFRDNQFVQERIMDSNDLERERGITILSKNTSVTYKDTKINIIDTPGHSDFGGEVERVLNMVEGILLVVDSVEGPMPQTRFVLKKALEFGHSVVVVVNKIDRPSARPEFVVNSTFELFIELNATDEQCDFQVIYASGIKGKAGLSPEDLADDLGPLFESIIRCIPGPRIVKDGALQMLVTSIEYDEHKGRIAIGRVLAGTLEKGLDVRVCTSEPTFLSSHILLFLSMAPKTTVSTNYQTTRVLPEPDVFIHCSQGTRIPAHAAVLASVSPVLENFIDRPRKHRSSEKIIQIQGVPCDAVIAFVGFLYSSRCTEEAMDKYGMHLLALSHVYLVPQLKQRCIKGLTQRLTTENVVDVLQLARLCDAPDLHLRCMKLLTYNFKAVEATEGWKFLVKHDPWLELDILSFIDEHETRKKKSRRYRMEQGLYGELSEAMECLEHICAEGCTHVGPHDAEVKKERRPCGKFSTCEGLQVLIRHFATCEKKMGGGCVRCKRMWQLFRLHSYVCHQTDLSCKVPFCRQFQLKMQQEKRKDDAKWKLLARKVTSAKVLSSLSLPKRKRDEEIGGTINNPGIRSFKLL